MFSKFVEMKTIEVWKTAPKEVPFKIYIYEYVKERLEKIEKKFDEENKRFAKSMEIIFHNFCKELKREAKKNEKRDIIQSEENRSK